MNLTEEVEMWNQVRNRSDSNADARYTAHCQLPPEKEIWEMEPVPAVLMARCSQPRRKKRS